MFQECRKYTTGYDITRETISDCKLSLSENIFLYRERLRTNGKFQDEKHCSHRKLATNDNNGVIVLTCFEVNPHTSIRIVAAETDVTNRSVRRISKVTVIQFVGQLFIFLSLRIFTIDCV